jgi:hypothetical protein
MNALRAIRDFLVDLIIGDDPKIAASVLIAVGLAAVVLVTGALPDAVVLVVGAALIVTAFTVSLFIDVRA